MLEITTPPGCTAEREYVLGVIFEDWLGLSYSLRQADVAATTVRLADQPGEVCLPDRFFSQFVERPGQWLEEASMPSQPLHRWDSRALAVDITLVDPVLPVIFGEPIAGDAVAPSPNQSADSPEPTIRLPIDIFGSAFFMLSRYEEVVRPDRDEHDRFPAWASLAYQEGFLHRPIIDEYLEILWAAMKSTWPALKRRNRGFDVKVSHDVDRPSRYAFGSMLGFVRSVASDLLKHKDMRSVAASLPVRFGSRRNLHPCDPDNTFAWIMDVSEERGLVSAFYFICGRTDPARDAKYGPEHLAIRHLLREVHRRGHEIGLHPSYNTYRDPGAIALEAKRLREVCAQEGVQQKHWGGRMHYLRWGTPVTMRGWEGAGMTYDSTLGYADQAGFRCGTCREYYAFDVLRREGISLIIRPLIAMECSVLAEKYESKSISEAWSRMRDLKSACRQVGGTFTLLWHNSYLHSSKLKQLYLDTLDA